MLETNRAATLARKSWILVQLRQRDPELGDCPGIVTTRAEARAKLTGLARRKRRMYVTLFLPVVGRVCGRCEGNPVGGGID